MLAIVLHYVVIILYCDIVTSHIVQWVLSVRSQLVQILQDAINSQILIPHLRLYLRLNSVSAAHVTVPFNLLCFEYPMFLYK